VATLENFASGLAAANFIIYISKNGKKIPKNHIFWVFFPFSEINVGLIAKFHPNN
jgi:hypothetical protein